MAYAAGRSAGAGAVGVAASSASMCSWQDPQPVPASVASPTSSTVRAPPAMHARTARSQTAKHMQTYTGAPSVK